MFLLKKNLVLQITGKDFRDDEEEFYKIVLREKNFAETIA